MQSNYTPSADHLRELLPTVSRNMEHELIKQQIRGLNIKFKSRTIKGDLVIEIPMQPNHILRISPLDGSQERVGQFISYVKERPARRTNEELVMVTKETVSAKVEIINVTPGDDVEPVIFTFHKRNMQTLIAAACMSLFRLNGEKLYPIKRTGARPSREAE
jgi:hypothetical protein